MKLLFTVVLFLGVNLVAQAGPAAAMEVPGFPQSEELIDCNNNCVQTAQAAEEYCDAQYYDDYNSCLHSASAMGCTFYLAKRDLACRENVTTLYDSCLAACRREFPR